MKRLPIAQKRHQVQSENEVTKSVTSSDTRIFDTNVEIDSRGSTEEEGPVVASVAGGSKKLTQIEDSDDDSFLLESRPSLVANFCLILDKRSSHW